MRKIVVGFVLACLFFGVHSVGFSQEPPTAEPFGILPAPDPQGSDATCGSHWATYQKEVSTATALPPGTDRDTQLKDATKTYNEKIKSLDVGTKIKGGCVQLSDMPILVIKLIDLCTKLAGTIAVIFLLYAGFQMIISGVSDDREAAKNTIKYALTGLIVSFLAWVIVNLIQVQLTSL